MSEEPNGNGEDGFDGFGHLSDRELLLLTARDLRRHMLQYAKDQKAQAGRCDNHGRRIGILETWSTGLTGAWAGLVAYIKIKASGG